MKHSVGPAVAVDLDGVLGDISLQLVRFSANEYQLRLQQKRFISENIETCTPITQGQLRQLFETPSFFQTMPPIRGASKWLKVLHSRGSAISIVTDRFWYQGIDKDTTDWLLRHEIPYDSVVFARKSEKQDFAKQLNIEWFIEDQLSNARLLSAVCRVILIDRPYNRGELPKTAVRTKTLRDAISHIESARK